MPLVGKGPFRGLIRDIADLKPLNTKGIATAPMVDIYGNGWKALTGVYDADKWGGPGRNRQTNASKIFVNLVITNLAAEGYFKNNPHNAITDAQLNTLPEVVNNEIRPDPASKLSIKESLFIGEVPFEVTPSKDGKFDGKITALVCPQLRLAVFQRVTSFNAQFAQAYDQAMGRLLSDIVTIAVDVVTYNYAGAIKALEDAFAIMGDVKKWQSDVAANTERALNQAVENANNPARKIGDSTDTMMYVIIGAIALVLLGSE